MTVQGIGSPYINSGTNPFGPIGEMTFSPQGDKLLAVTATGVVDVFDFDRCTGLLSNWDSLGTPAPFEPGPNIFYGCSFSPDGTKVYASEIFEYNSTTLWQWDLTAPDVRASKTLIYTVADSMEFGQHQLGPDGKIYITQLQRWRNDDPANVHLSVINDPNQAGLACNFAYATLSLGGKRAFYNLPNLPNYNLPPLVAQYADCGPSERWLCPGDSLLLGQADTTGGAVTFAWSGQGITDPSLAQQWVQPASSGWYYLTVTDSAVGIPCGVTFDSVYVEVLSSSDLPVASLGMDTVLCQGDSVLLGGPADTAWVYAWNTGGDTSRVWAAVAGDYALTVTNPVGNAACLVAVDTVHVGFFPSVSLPLQPAGPDTVICLGDSARLGIPAAAGWAYQWLPTSYLDSATVAMPLSLPTTTVYYVLSAVDSASAGRCATIRDTILVTVEQPFVHQRPEDQVFCPGEILTVGVSSGGGFHYAWSPYFGLNDPFAASTTVAPLADIVYTLAITSDTMVSVNCKTQYFPITLSTKDCIVQNVVTPNGDGINDFLALGTFNQAVALSVYDRWGALVFSSPNYLNDWPNGNSDLPETVYYYVVSVGGAGGKRFVGEVMVLR